MTVFTWVGTGRWVVGTRARTAIAPGIEIAICTHCRTVPGTAADLTDEHMPQGFDGPWSAEMQSVAVATLEHHNHTTATPVITIRVTLLQIQCTLEKLSAPRDGRHAVVRDWWDGWRVVRGKGLQASGDLALGTVAPRKSPPISRESEHVEVASG